jgi:hypothetical protein
MNCAVPWHTNGCKISYIHKRIRNVAIEFTWSVRNKYTYCDLQQFVVFLGNIHTYSEEWEQEIYIQAKVTLPNQTFHKDKRKYKCNNYIKPVRIFMKSGIDFMPLTNNKNPQSLTSHIQ